MTTQMKQKCNILPRSPEHGTYAGTSTSLYTSVLDSVIDTMRRDSFSEKEVIDVFLNVLKSQEERHWDYMCQRENEDVSKVKEVA